MTLQLGDVVTVARECMGNRAGSRAVVVEEYDIGKGPSWSLLFENGAHDGFPPTDLDVFGVQKVGHEPTLARYRFTSAMKLYMDWRNEYFKVVWAGVRA